MMELLSRIRALLRRSGANDGRMEELSRRQSVCQPDPPRGAGGWKGRCADLKEFELLNLLISRQGIVFTRAQLLDEIWDTASMAKAGTVDVHVRTLRQNLGPAGNYIETVRGIGYKIGGEKE